MKVITIKDPAGTTQVAVEESPRELQVLRSPDAQPERKAS